MLTESERKGCQKLLEVVNDFDLRCLVQTITQNLVAVESRQEAVDAIIQYSASLDELLNRQKVKKEHLQRFLIASDKNLLSYVVKADKETLIRFVKEALIQGSKTDESTQSFQSSQSFQSTQSVPQQQCQEIAAAFVPWFYNMINSTNSATADSGWKSSHFWDDAKLVLEVQEPDSTARDEIQSAASVSQKLLAFSLAHQVIYSANLESNGIESEMNCHGLLLVKSAGTLHRNSVVVGIYEQLFGLIKDPVAEGNWKIKSTELKAKFKCNYQKPIMPR